jgi:hypothetical protein
MLFCIFLYSLIVMPFFDENGLISINGIMIENVSQFT